MVVVFVQGLFLLYYYCCGHNRYCGYRIIVVIGLYYMMSICCHGLGDKIHGIQFKIKGQVENSKKHFGIQTSIIFHSKVSGVNY